ncbi:hypothetical protein PROFUN_07632 [Planoprotostelium fungivorum]|uniref:Uncharacterized protein n=1 Tax=Planoprotostelium fungivorum TaxID=1890364 RepID=A0A2P6NK51_9EUKA|nr:hypothetical protein PROFUN_07632 [Planoprotostelium fungivorum]
MIIGAPKVSPIEVRDSVNLSVWPIEITSKSSLTRCHNVHLLSLNCIFL